MDIIILSCSASIHCSGGAGFTVPLYFGTGLFTSVGFLPYPVQLNVVVGAPIDVPKYEGEGISPHGSSSSPGSRARG